MDKFQSQSLQYRLDQINYNMVRQEATNRLLLKTQMRMLEISNGMTTELRTLEKSLDNVGRMSRGGGSSGGGGGGFMGGGGGIGGATKLLAVVETIRGLSDMFRSVASGVRGVMNEAAGAIGETIPNIASAMKYQENYNKQLLVTAASWSKYGVGIGAVEQSMESLRKATGLSREETLSLMSLYESGFNFVSLDRGAKLMENLKNVTGGNKQAMQDLLGVVQGLSQKYPELEQSLIRLSGADKERLGLAKEMMLITGKLSFQESKRMTDYIDQNHQVLSADQERKKDITDQIDAINQLRQSIENMTKAMGGVVMPYAQSANAYLQKQGASAEDMGKIAVKGEVAEKVAGVGMGVLGGAEIATRGLRYMYGRGGRGFGRPASVAAEGAETGLESGLGRTAASTAIKETEIGMAFPNMSQQMVKQLANPLEQTAGKGFASGLTTAFAEGGWKSLFVTGLKGGVTALKGGIVAAVVDGLTQGAINFGVAKMQGKSTAQAGAEIFTGESARQSKTGRNLKAAGAVLSGAAVGARYGGAYGAVAGAAIGAGKAVYDEYEDEKQMKAESDAAEKKLQYRLDRQKAYQSLSVANPQQVAEAEKAARNAELTQQATEQANGGYHVEDIASMKKVAQQQRNAYGVDDSSLSNQQMVVDQLKQKAEAAKNDNNKEDYDKYSQQAAKEGAKNDAMLSQRQQIDNPVITAERSNDLRLSMLNKKAESTGEQSQAAMSNLQAMVETANTVTGEIAGPAVMQQVQAVRVASQEAYKNQQQKVSELQAQLDKFSSPEMKAQMRGETEARIATNQAQIGALSNKVQSGTANDDDKLRLANLRTQVASDKTDLAGMDNGSFETDLRSEIEKGKAQLQQQAKAATNAGIELLNTCNAAIQNAATRVAAVQSNVVLQDARGANGAEGLANRNVQLNAQQDELGVLKQKQEIAAKLLDSDKQNPTYQQKYNEITTEINNKERAILDTLNSIKEVNRLNIDLAKSELNLMQAQIAVMDARGSSGADTAALRAQTEDQILATLQQQRQTVDAYNAALADAESRKKGATDNGDLQGAADIEGQIKNLKKGQNEAATELLNTSKQLVETAKQFSQQNALAKEIAAGTTQLYENQVQLADSMGFGVRASADARMRVVDAAEKELELNDQNLATIQQQEAEWRQRTAQLQAQHASQEEIDQAQGQVNNYVNERLKVENQSYQLQMKQVNAVKSLRDGYVSAIAAMTTGSGIFSKILVSQDKNMGMFLSNTKGGVQSLTTGGVGSGRNTAGYNSSERYVAGPDGNVSIGSSRNTSPMGQDKALNFINAGGQQFANAQAELRQALQSGDRERVRKATQAVTQFSHNNSGEAVGVGQQPGGAAVYAQNGVAAGGNPNQPVAGASTAQPPTNATASGPMPTNGTGAAANPHGTNADAVPVDFAEKEFNKLTEIADILKGIAAHNGGMFVPGANGSAPVAFVPNGVAGTPPQTTAGPQPYGSNSKPVSGQPTAAQPPVKDATPQEKAAIQKYLTGTFFPELHAAAGQAGVNLPSDGKGVSDADLKKLMSNAQFIHLMQNAPVTQGSWGKVQKDMTDKGIITSQRGKMDGAPDKPASQIDAAAVQKELTEKFFPQLQQIGKQSGVNVSADGKGVSDADLSKLMANPKFVDLMNKTSVTQGAWSGVQQDMANKGAIAKFNMDGTRPGSQVAQQGAPPAKPAAQPLAQGAPKDAVPVKVTPVTNPLPSSQNTPDSITPEMQAKYAKEKNDGEEARANNESRRRSGVDHHDEAMAARMAKEVSTPGYSDTPEALASNKEYYDRLEKLQNSTDSGSRQKGQQLASMPMNTFDDTKKFFQQLESAEKVDQKIVNGATASVQSSGGAGGTTVNVPSVIINNKGGMTADQVKAEATRQFRLHLDSADIAGAIQGRGMPGAGGPGSTPQSNAMSG